MWHNHFVCWVVFRPTLSLSPLRSVGLNGPCEVGYYELD